MWQERTTLVKPKANKNHPLEKTEHSPVIVIILETPIYEKH